VINRFNSNKKEIDLTNFLEKVNSILLSFSFVYLITMTAIESPIVQYILLRRDLKKMKNYNDGAIIAQACHASTAAIYKSIDDEITKLYLNDLDRMHKVTLGVDGGADQLNEISQLLKENSIQHYLWIEQPENIPTALALKPYYKKDVEQFFSNLKLYR